MRLAEAYLIRAEANAKSNNFGAALADLTILRTQRGLGAITPVPADAAVLDAVLLEKRREFAFEGHRFFDLIRNGKDIVRNFCNNTYTATSGSCTIKADANIVVAPIPQTERNVNPLEQNQGYDQ
ncbi:RagB/SusD family nutrient uptake outer membrane protein [Chitinophaga sedimenti]|nr:RagB/SusD family nutrient uptake outer membrane protein [Chitinophaga sedimenti]